MRRPAHAVQRGASFRLAGLLVLLGLVCTPAARAQVGSAPVPTVDPGGVATVIFQLPAPAGADSAEYSLRLGAGFRTFGAAQGAVARSGETFVIPVSFATPAGLAAGDTVAGTLSVAAAGHGTSTRDIRIRVRARRSVSFQLELDETTITPNGITELSYRIHNLGNVTDTVFLSGRGSDAWAVLDAPAAELAAGDSVAGTLRIIAPASATPGDRQLLLITARSSGAEKVAPVNVTVVSSTGWLGGLAHVPSSVFVGQPIGGGAGPAFALTGGGRVGAETDVRIDLRHSDVGAADPALQRQVGGPGLRLAIERPDMRAHLGDVYGYASTLTGYLRQARGIRVEHDAVGDFGARLLLAVPAAFDGSLLGGHIVQGEASLATVAGDVALIGADMVLPARPGGDEFRTSGGGLRWKAAAGVHAGSVEATVVRLAAGDSLVRVGPGLDASYELRSQVVSGRARLRRVPGGAAADGGQGDELSGAVSARVAESLYLVGWGYGTRRASLGTESSSESYAGSLGARSRLGPLQLQLAATTAGNHSVTPDASFGTERRTLRAEGTFTRGRWTALSDVEVGGASEFGREGAYRLYGASVRWQGGRNWGWVRAQHALRPGGLSSSAVMAGGTLEYGPLRVSGGGGVNRAAGFTSTSVWSAAEVRADRNTSVHLGASRRPTGPTGEWSFSIGVRRDLSLPLPLRRRPDLHGVVFDDRNGNGWRDEGEPGIEGVGLGLGYLSTATDGAGEFAFRDASGMPLRLRAAELPTGYLAPPGLTLPARGRAEIGLLKAASLQLTLFLDRDEDGQRDPAESVGAGALVTLTDDKGRQRSALAGDDGAVRLSGLLPGRYSVTARPADSQERQRREAEVLMEIELAPGEAAEKSLAVPLRRRTIRMGAGAADVLLR